MTNQTIMPNKKTKTLSILAGVFFALAALLTFIYGLIYEIRYYADVIKYDVRIDIYDVANTLSVLALPASLALFALLLFVTKNRKLLFIPSALFLVYTLLYAVGNILPYYFSVLRRILARGAEFFEYFLETFFEHQIWNLLLDVFYAFGAFLAIIGVLILLLLKNKKTDSKMLKFLWPAPAVLLLIFRLLENIVTICYDFIYCGYTLEAFFRFSFFRWIFWPTFGTVIIALAFFFLGFWLWKVDRDNTPTPVAPAAPVAPAFTAPAAPVAPAFTAPAAPVAPAAPAFTAPAAPVAPAAAPKIEPENDRPSDL